MRRDLLLFYHSFSSSLGAVLILSALSYCFNLRTRRGLHSLTSFFCLNSLKTVSQPVAGSILAAHPLQLHQSRNEPIRTGSRLADGLGREKGKGGPIADTVYITSPSPRAGAKRQSHHELIHPSHHHVSDASPASSCDPSVADAVKPGHDPALRRQRAREFHPVPSIQPALLIPPPVLLREPNELHKRIQ